VLVHRFKIGIWKVHTFAKKTSSGGSDSYSKEVQSAPLESTRSDYGKFMCALRGNLGVSKQVSRQFRCAS
jgi:hypothetical protein